MDFIELQEKIKDRLARDRSVRSVSTEGVSLDQALEEAATLLDVPRRRVEFEIMERGFPGFLGAGKKAWKIQAYERQQGDEIRESEEFFDDEFGSGEEIAEDRDGGCFLQVLSTGVMLKVTPPEGMGKPAQESAAWRLLSARRIGNADDSLVAETVRRAEGVYTKVADIEWNPSNDTSFTVELTDQNMKAWMKVSPPGPGGRDLSAEEYITEIKASKIYYGLREDFIRTFADAPVYREAVLVAEGIKPVHGRDAYIQYNFETDPKKVRIREGSDGRVDFKQLHVIQNVVKDHVLARKIPAEKGVAGKTISGTVLPATDGKDIPIPLGENVHLAEDGVTILAGENGQVLLSGDRINVEPSYLVKGNVGIQTGNIDFLGNVIITGNVDDGFSVKAEGNIEVTGMVERAELQAGGNIIIHQGVTGKGSGNIRAEQSVWAKFLENCFVTAGSMVFVNDGIVNSQVDSFDRIIVQGKRANVVGGRLRATTEIRAKAIGSPLSGTETICEAGYDLRAKLRYEWLEKEMENAEQELQELERSLQMLINIKKQRKTIPADKEEEMQQMTVQRQKMLALMRTRDEEMANLKLALDEDEDRGKVSASEKVHPGVKIILRDAREEVKNNYKAVSFVLKDGQVRAEKYEEDTEDYGKGFDAGSAD